MKQLGILYSGQLERDLKKMNKSLIRQIPWDLVKDHEEQAFKNHGQSLTQLKERNGVGLLEVYAIIQDIKFREVKLNEYECFLWLENLLADFNKN